jgi:hypothetical protein
MSFKEYDPTQVTVSLAGIVVQGYADGEFVGVEQETDNFSDVAGTDGEVSRARTSDRRATIRFVLMQTSSSNDLLSSLANLDLKTPGGSGVGALYIRDRLGRALYRAQHAWIQKPPDVSFDREPTPREWTIRCARLERVDGGN